MADKANHSSVCGIAWLYASGRPAALKFRALLTGSLPDLRWRCVAVAAVVCVQLIAFLSSEVALALIYYAGVAQLN